MWKLEARLAASVGCIAGLASLSFLSIFGYLQRQIFSSITSGCIEGGFHYHLKSEASGINGFQSLQLFQLRVPPLAKLFLCSPARQPEALVYNNIVLKFASRVRPSQAEANTWVGPFRLILKRVCPLWCGRNYFGGFLRRWLILRKSRITGNFRPKIFCPDYRHPQVWGGCRIRILSYQLIWMAAWSVSTVLKTWQSSSCVLWQ